MTDGFVVTCPDVPGFSYPIRSLWEACGVREMLSQRIGAPTNFIWLHIRAKLSDVTLVSDVHPLHETSLHTIACPAIPGSSGTGIIFEYARTALEHEADQAARTDANPQVKFVLSFLDGSRAFLPRREGYFLPAVLDEVEAAKNLTTWTWNELTGRFSGTASAHSPITGLQIAISNQHTQAQRRYR